MGKSDILTMQKHRIFYFFSLFFLFIFLSSLVSATTTTYVADGITVRAYKYTASLGNQFPPANSIPPFSTLTEASGAQYTSLSAIDTNRWSYAVVDSSHNNGYLLGNGTVSEYADPSKSVSSITWTWTIDNQDSGIDKYFYLWNNTNSSWYECTTPLLTGIGQDTSKSCTISSGLSDFIDSNNQIYFLVYANKDTTTGSMQNDYLAMAVSYSATTSTLTSPSNNTYSSSTSQTFNCSATDDTSLNNITLYGNFNGTFLANQTNTITGVSNTTSFSVSLSQGSYIWNCKASGTASPTGVFATSNRTLTIDTTNPLVQFVTTTETNNSLLTRNYIQVNVTSTDTNFANITIRLYNSSKSLLQTGTSTSPFFVNYTSLSDGIYYFNATSVDLAGNINNTETRQITIDATPPTIQYVNPTTSSGNFSQNWIYINVTASDTSLSKIIINLYNSSFLINSSLSSSSPAFINFTNLAEGLYYFNSTANDTTGNTNFTTTTTVTLDRTNPLISYNPTTETDGSNLSRNNIFINVSVTDTNEKNITFKLFNTTSLVNSTTYTTAVRTINFTNLPSTTYTFNVTSSDAAGNTNSTASRTVRIDTVNPLISYTTNTAVDKSNVSQSYVFVNVSVTETNEANITFRLFNSTGNINSTAYSTAVRTINWTTLSNGIYTYNVTLVDWSGNSNNTETRTITLDTTNPNGTLISPINNTNSSSSSNNFTVNATDSLSGLTNATLKIYNSSTLVNSTTTTLSGSIQIVIGTVVNLVDGVYKWFYSIFDLAGNSFNTINNTLTVDTTNPLVQFVSPSETNGTYLNRNNILINITSTDTNLANITINVYNSSLVNSTTTTASPNYINITNLANGVYYFNSTVKDFSGNQNSTSTRQVTLDTINPLVSYTTNTETDGSNISRSNVFVNVSVTETNEANITFSLYNSSGVVNSTIYTTPIRSINWTSLPDGVYTFNVTSNDLASNTNSTASRTVRIDTISPTIDLVHPGISEEFTSNVSVPLNFSVSDSGVGVSVCKFNIDNGVNTTISGCTNTTFSTSDSSHIINLFVNDTLGNTASVSHSFTISLSAPAITLDYPTNNSYFNRNTDIYLNWTASDSNGVSACQVWSDFGGSWSLNRTITPISSGVQKSSLYNVSEGIHLWNIWCNDTLSNGRFASHNFTFTTDTTLPSVSITTVSATAGDHLVGFSSSVSDTNLNSCKFALRDSNGSIEIGNTTLTCGAVSYPITVSTFDSTYTLYLYANDLAGNENLVTKDFSVPSSSSSNIGGGGGGGSNITTFVILSNRTYCGDGICQANGNDNNVSEDYYTCNTDCQGFNIDTAFFGCFSSDPKLKCLWDQATFKYIGAFIALLILVGLIGTTNYKGKQVPVYKYAYYKANNSFKGRRK